MSVKLSVELRGQKATEHLLDVLSGPEVKGAYAKALTDTGFQGRRFMQKKFGSSFDRVTPFIQRAPKVFPATPQDLSVSIAPTLHTRRLPSKGGKVGVDPQDVLQAQAVGGTRRDKRSEVALRRAGLLPIGMQTAIPMEPYPGSDDGRGNIKGAFMAQLISYLQASGEQGYRANMKAKAKAKIEDRTKYSHIKTRKTVSMIRGRAYFVSKGNGHLPAGVWAASGTHGATIKPVLMFVRRGVYQPRLDMDGIAQEAGLQDYLDKRVRFRLREAAGV